MSDAAGEFPSNVVKKVCSTCGALMPHQAVKCTKCDSYQNWFRNINLSITMVALLTALVSVAGSTLPGLFNWLRSGDSRLAVSYAYDDDQGGFFLTVTNDGDRVGSIGKVEISVPLKDQKHTFVGTLDPAYNPSVEPNKSQKIRYTLDVETELEHYTADDVVDKCVIFVDIREFVVKERPPLPLPLSKKDCGNLRPLDFGRKSG
jgi:ribosomal protein L40E